MCGVFSDFSGRLILYAVISRDRGGCGLNQAACGSRRGPWRTGRHPGLCGPVLPLKTKVHDASAHSMRMVRHGVVSIDATTYLPDGTRTAHNGTAATCGCAAATGMRTSMCLDILYFPLAPYSITSSSDCVRCSATRCGAVEAMRAPRLGRPNAAQAAGTAQRSAGGRARRTRKPEAGTLHSAACRLIFLVNGRSYAEGRS